MLDWDGTCTVSDSLVDAVRSFGDPRVLGSAHGSYGESLAAEVGSIRAPAEEVSAWAVEHVRVRPGLHALAERFRPVIVSSGLPQLIAPVLEREGLELEVRCNGADPLPDGWRVRFRDEGPCPVCGDMCKRRSLPERAGARLRRRRRVRPLRRACLRPDLRPQLARRRARARGDPVRAVRDSRRRCCCPFLSRTTSSSRRSGSGCSGPTSRTSGSTARCTARSAGARCGSQPRAAGSTSSRSTISAGRWSRSSSASRSTSTPSRPGPRRSRCSRRSSRASPGSGRRSRPTRSRASSPRSRRSRSRSTRPSRSAAASSSGSAPASGRSLRFRRERGSRRQPRTSSSRSASRGERRTTPSGSRAPTSTSTPSQRFHDDEVRARLIAVRGIGAWTAEWFLARHLARPRRGPPATLPCGRRSISSTVQTCTSSARASTRSRTSPPTTS